MDADVCGHLRHQNLKSSGLARANLIGYTRRPNRVQLLIKQGRVSENMKKKSSSSIGPKVGIIMGSNSDWPTMEKAAQVLKDFGVEYEALVVSAHRTPEKMFSYAKDARSRGLKTIIAGAGGAAHLPGMVSALTTLPILAVPIQSRVLNGVDSLLSIVQMPAGIPTATFAIGEAGATNAGLFAISLLALEDSELAGKLSAYREGLKAKVEAMELS